MRKIIVSEFVTVNGVMEAPETWSLPFWNDEQGAYKHAELFAADALLLGRATYDEFAASWPTMAAADIAADLSQGGGEVSDDVFAGFADRMNSLPKYVVSTTLDAAEWNNSQVIKDNVVDEIARLKQQPGQDILVAGSAELVRTLAKHGLVDEYRLMIYPVVVGQGKRLFSDELDMATLRLTDTKTFSTGVILLTYEVVPAA